jgi:large subunit ribosomal protein L35
MPKIKTHRGTAKRVKVSANGKVMHRHQFSGCGHILSKKTRKRKRNFRKDQPVFAGDLKRFAPQIPYLLQGDVRWHVSNAAFMGSNTAAK